jgi:lysophospholipase L1-like esterase
LVVLGFGVLAGAGLAELGVRAYVWLGGERARGIAQLDPMAVLVEPHGRMGYRQKPHSTYRYRNGTAATSNALGYRGPEVAVPKPDGTFRVVLLGESTTHGWGVRDSQTIDAYMRLELSRRFPEHRWEVVNLAFDGYDSWQLLERLRSDGLRFQPDLVIAHTGINDVRNARFRNLSDPDPRTVLWTNVLDRLREERRQGGPALTTRIKHYSYLARLPGLMKQRQQRRREGFGQRPDLQPNPVAVDRFERNVERLGTLAGRAGVPVLFSTPPSLLAGSYDPTALRRRDYWIVDLPTTQRYRELLAERMGRVADRLGAQGYRALHLRHDPLPAELFLDDCHLTAEGSRRLATLLVEAMLRLAPELFESGDIPHDPGTQPRRQRERQSSPQPRSPGVGAVVGRRGLARTALGVLVPPQLFVPGSPLLLEAVGATSPSAASEVEPREPALRRPLDEQPVDQHVGRHGVVRHQRGGPGHLELAAEGEAAPAGHGLVLEVRYTDPRIIGESSHHRFEESLRHGRRAEVAHVAGEDGEERLQLVRAELHFDALLLRPSNLAAELGAERVPHTVGIARREVEHHGDLAVGRRELQRQLTAAAHLEQARSAFAGDLHRAGGQRAHGIRAA